MSFTSIYFYICLLIAVAVFYWISAKWRVSYLIGVSCVFYATYSFVYLFLLIATTLGVYVVGIWLADAKSDPQRFRLLLLGLVPVIGVLVLFKALNVADAILIPIGLSYYSFKLISYLVEVYWDEAQVERTALRFVAFSTFGPQMVSGPIQRHYQFLPQLTQQAFVTVDFALIESGLRLILGGLLLKLVVGDRLGAFVALVDQNQGQYSWSVIATSTLCYMPYLFADFAGYTNIAIGIGRLFGIESPPNFAAPFSATNIQEFWRRWHMTLTSWLGDYVFSSLRMQTRTWGDLGLAVSLLTNMTLIGMWHGFKWTFFLFGIFHGIVLTFSALTTRRRERLLKGRAYLQRLDRIFGVLSTFLLMTLSQILFQGENLSSATQRLALLVGVKGTGTLGFQDIPTDIFAPVTLCAVISFYVGFGMPGMVPIGNTWSRIVPNWLSYGLGLLLLSTCMSEAGSRFIYGQF